MAKIFQIDNTKLNTKTANISRPTLNVGVAASVGFERDCDRLLPHPNICGCGHVYKHISFIKHVLPFYLLL